MRNFRKRLGTIAAIAALGTALVQGPPAAAIDGGRDDAGTRAANATVRVGGGCTGTLIAKDVVLTAGHCVNHNRPDGQTDDFPGPYDWEYPTKWYPLNNPFDIVVGNDRVGVTSFGTTSGTTDTSFELNDLNGDYLRHGDTVEFISSKGFLLYAMGGFGGRVHGDGDVSGNWSKFIIRKASAGTDPYIRPGVPITLETFVRDANGNPRYVAAEQGGGALDVNANRTAVGSWERFTLVNNHGLNYFLDTNKVSIRTSNEHFITATGGGGAGHHVRAVSYSIPVNTDMMLLKLESAVPSWLATPAFVLTRPPADSVNDPDAFWAQQTFRMAGWSRQGDAAGKRYRQTADAQRGYFCNTFNWSWAGKMCVDGVNGARIRPGDSGGPLYWTDPKTYVTYVIGVTQGEETTGGRYMVTFARGQRASDGSAKSDIGVFIEEALGKERCISFDPDNAGIVSVFGTYFLYADGKFLEDFPSRSEADQGLRAVQHYRFGRRCTIENESRPLTYWLTETGRGPSGTMAGEDGVYFDRQRVKPELSNGRWKLTAGNLWLEDFGTEPIAGYVRASYARWALGRYGFNRMVFIGRPGSSMVYFTN